jgi:Arc/MetJ-type ribon-helix-helix transcriptional regulator
MTMSLLQVRVPDGIVTAVNRMVESGLYSSKSDVVRDAIRQLVLEKQIGSVPNTGDSVKEIRAIRNKLSKEIKTFEDLKRLNKSYC